MIKFILHIQKIMGNVHTYDILSGNTGVGLAIACEAKGYPCVVTMIDFFNIERRRIMQFLGRSLSCNALMIAGEGDLDPPRPERYANSLKCSHDSGLGLERMARLMR